MNSDKPTPETFLCFSVHLYAQYQTSPRHSQTPIYPHTNTFLKAVRGTVPLHRKQKQNLSGPLSTPWTRIDMTWSCTTGTRQLMHCRMLILSNDSWDYKPSKREQVLLWWHYFITKRFKCAVWNVPFDYNLSLLFADSVSTLSTASTRSCCLWFDTNMQVM